MSLRGGSAQRTYAAERASVFNAVLSALEEYNMKVTDKDPVSGLIRAHTGFSVFSTGSEIEITVSPGTGSGEVTVTAQAKPRLKTVATDWGQGAREVNKLLSRVDEAFGQSVVANEAGGTKCPSCGATVSPQDKFCQNCGAQLQKSP